MKYLAVLFLAILAIPFGAFAQDVEPVATPLMTTIFYYLGIASAIAGSLWGLAKLITKLTPTKKDDLWMDKLEGNVKDFIDKLPADIQQQIKDAFNGKP